MSITVRVHYREDDPHFLSDYCAVEVFFDDRLIRTYGDSFHQKGLMCAVAFTEGMKYMDDTLKVTYEDVADYVE